MIIVPHRDEVIVAKTLPAAIPFGTRLDDLSHDFGVSAVANQANLTDANLINADLTFANLNNANLSGADLSGAILTNANLAGVIGWDTVKGV